MSCRYSVKRRGTNILEICNKVCAQGSDRCPAHTDEALSKKRNDTQNRRELIKVAKANTTVKPVYSLISQVADVDPILDEYLAADKKLKQMNDELNKTIERRGLHIVKVLDQDEEIDNIVLRMKQHLNYMDTLRAKLDPKMDELDKTTGAHKVKHNHTRKQTKYDRRNNHTTVSSI